MQVVGDVKKEGSNGQNEIEEVKEVVDEEEKDVKVKVEDIKMEKGEKRSAEAMEIESEDEEADVKRTKMSDDLEMLKKHLPQVTVEPVEVPEDSGYTHHVALPSGGTNAPLKPLTNPVRTYAYKLDYFQERAVTIVDNYQSVLVSAHTSAGKTTVAE